MAEATSIIIDPRAQALLDGIAKVKQDIIDILFEHDSIVLQENPSIEHEYMVRVGCWEKLKLEEYANALRAKRKHAFAQQAANQDSMIDEMAIEQLLDKELSDWDAHLAAVFSSFSKIISENSVRMKMSKEESKELTFLYRKIMKRLHPDLLSNPTKQQSELFFATQQAFHNGDVLALRAIETVLSGAGVRDFETAPESKTSIDQLRIELLGNETTRDILASKLEQLKQECPYSYKERLADTNWVRETVSKLQEGIESSIEVRKRYTERYLLLLKKQGGGQ
ncbi:MAG: hypothetical protein GX626_09410 [Spirochaetales bacterium]|nr:hypothetical protein [Spirochaetales bacterium]